VADCSGGIGLSAAQIVRWHGQWIMDGRIMRRGITGSYQSAATSEIAKRV